MGLQNIAGVSKLQEMTSISYYIAESDSYRGMFVLGRQLLLGCTIVSRKRHLVILAEEVCEIPTCLKRFQP